MDCHLDLLQAGFILWAAKEVVDLLMVVRVWTRCFQSHSVLFKDEIKVHTDYKVSTILYSKQRSERNTPLRWTVEMSEGTQGPRLWFGASFIRFKRRRT